MQVEVLRESITHTFDVNQVQVPQTSAGDLCAGCHDKYHMLPYQETYRHHQADAKEIATCPDLRAQANPPVNSEVLHMVRRQEMAWENAEAAVQKLDRRLRILERSDSLNKASISSHVIHENLNSATQFSACSMQSRSPVPLGPPAAPYSCIYVSPVYDDKRGNTMYHTQLVEDRGYGFRSRYITDRIGEDEKDLEIRRLALDLQRQDLEMRRLKADLHKMRALEFEDDRNIISDKHVDKACTMAFNTSTMRRPQSYHEGLHCVKTGSVSSYSTSEGSAESPKANTYNPFVDGISDIPCGMSQKSNLGFQGSSKPVRESLLRREGREHTRVPSAGSELERCDLTLECSNNPFMVQRISAIASTMQESVENLCNNIKMREPQDTDSSKIDSGAIDDELFILKKTLSRLQDLCQQAGHEFPDCDNRKIPLEADKENLLGTIDGMLHQLARVEFKAIAVESSCAEKERRLEDLESQLHALLKEKEALVSEKYHLTNVIHEMQQDAAEQRHRIEELLRINEELLEISQAEEDKLGTFQETKNKLVQQVVQYEDNCANFESLLQEKEEEVQELNRRLKAGQIGADSIIFEKFELLSKIQAMQMESDEQKKRIDELVSINEELLEFAQSKEDQVAYLGSELDRFQAECKEKKESNSILLEANREEQMKDSGKGA